MPEIEMLYVYHWPADDTYTVGTPTNEQVQSETPAREFGVSELAELGQEHGVSRWTEATDEDRKTHDRVSYSADRVVLVGWADAPIARSDVQTSYHNRTENQPMVRVKVDKFELPDGDPFAELVSEFELDNRLAGLPLSELRDLIEKRLETDDFWFGDVCRQGFEYAEMRAEELFEGHSVKCWQAGRSGGWLVVEGLPDVSGWDAALLTKWQEFEGICRDQVEDIPRAMAWSVLANDQDELAGRVMRVELTFVLSDEDLESAGADPNEWDWVGMLNLSAGTTVSVRDLERNPIRLVALPSNDTTT